MDTIDIVLIGLGKMGAIHYNALNRLKNGEFETYYKGGVENYLRKIRIAGVCDPDPARRIDAGVPFYSDHRELLAAHPPFIAVIAAPTREHVAIARDCLDAGAHAFVEKPLAPTVRDAIALQQLAFAKGRRLLSGHVERFNPVSVAVRDAIAGGKLGKPLKYSFTRVQPHADRIPDDVITDKLIHDVDLALNFFGRIDGFRVIDSRKKNDVVHEIKVELIHTSGAVGTVFTSWLVDEKIRECEIAFERGSLRADFVTKEYFIDGQKRSEFNPSITRGDNNAIKDELVDFIAICVGLMDGESRVQPIITLDEVIAALQVVELARQWTPEPR